MSEPGTVDAGDLLRRLLESQKEVERLRAEVQTYQEQNPEAATQGGYARERARAEQAVAEVARQRDRFVAECEAKHRAEAEVERLRADGLSVVNSLRRAEARLREVRLFRDKLKRKPSDTHAYGPDVHSAWVISELDAALAAAQPREDCPACGRKLERVTQSDHSMLNEHQWRSQIAGEWVCVDCSKPNDRGQNSKNSYWWTREVAAAQPEEKRTEALFKRWDGLLKRLADGPAEPKEKP